MGSVAEARQAPSTRIPLFGSSGPDEQVDDGLLAAYGQDIVNAPTGLAQRVNRRRAAHRPNRLNPTTIGSAKTT